MHVRVVEDRGEERRQVCARQSRLDRRGHVLAREVNRGVYDLRLAQESRRQINDELLVGRHVSDESELARGLSVDRYVAPLRVYLGVQARDAAGERGREVRRAGELRHARARAEE